MNNCTTDTSSNRNGSSATWSRRTLGLTVAILSVLAPAEAGFADNTLATASLAVWTDDTCATPTCSEARITVTLEGSCTGDVCSIAVSVSKEEDCGLFPTGFSSLVLYDNQTDSCTGTGTEAPYPVDLLAGAFTLSLTQWQNLFVVDHLIVADKGSGEATASANPQKAVSEIPTVSEWGLAIMVGFLLTAGTVVLRRSQPKPA